MSIIINDDLKNEIEKYIAANNGSWKEQTYDLIYDAMNGNDKIQYSDFSSLYNYYVDNNAKMKLLFQYDSVMKQNLKEQLSESLTNLFQNQKKSNFISNFDKEIINDYVKSVADYLGDPSYYKQQKLNSEAKLAIKLGKQDFYAWEKDNSIDNLVTIFANTFDEIVEKHDTHRYSPQTLDCFLKATIASDPNEALSECQYELHAIETNGGAFAPQEGDL
jgi:hypothetical protein